ncbi:MAG: glutathione S-transferase family protein [Alphaproteobacteria bacterium]
MGLLVDGVWRDRWYETDKSGGRFERPQTRFRDWVTADGTGAPAGRKAYPAAAGRYHLYVSLACPWAHRTLIARALKRLEGAVSVSVVDPFMGADGWQFTEAPGAVPDTVNGACYLREIYLMADPHYTGRVTVPVLWDRETGTVVNNESAEILRMFNGAFDGVGGDAGNAALDLYPADLRDAIDAVNARVYETVNNGVYRCGFATTQAAYDEAVGPLFDTLDWLERRLSDRRYLLGDRITEADWRLFTTLVRFDPVYVGHFKCNLRRLVDYPNLWAYTRELYQWPGVAATVNFDHIRRHYYTSHESINPHRIVPRGPAIDFAAPHDRGRLAAAV